MVGGFSQALSLSLALTGALAAPTRQSADDCVGVHMILVRGTDNSPTADGLDSIATQVQSMIGVETSDYVELNYPASEGENGSPSYQASIEAGEAQLTSDISSYAASCGYSKIVLIGYSQGATVIGNVLCGADDEGQGITPTDPLDPSLQHTIWASVWLGDPAHNPDQPWNQGDGSNGTHGIGAHSRSNSASCDYMTGKLVSYCSQGDKYCDSEGEVPAGEDPQTIHDDEIGAWANIAPGFIANLVGV